MSRLIAVAALAAAIGGPMSAAPASAQAAAPAQADIHSLSTVFDNAQSLLGWRQLDVPGFPAKWHAPASRVGTWSFSRIPPAGSRT